MKCPVERRQTIPHVTPGGAPSFVPVFSGYKQFVAPCGARVAKGQRACRSCLRGEEGDHDKLTAKGRRQVKQLGGGR